MMALRRPTLVLGIGQLQPESGLDGALGALGKKAEWLMRESGRVAEWKNRGVGELTHWSAMTWGEHWRQRIGVEIARGVARCVEKAATGGWTGSRAAAGRSHEYDRDCC